MALNVLLLPTWCTLVAICLSKSLLKAWPEAFTAQYTHKQIKRLSLLD